MANYSGSVTNNKSHFGVYLEAYESNVNTPNNTSVVTARLHITRSNWGWQTSNSYGGRIVIDGTSYSFNYSPNWAYASSGDVVVGSASKTVTHNDDGSKSCSVSGSWSTSGSYSCGTASASGTLQLIKIARASGISCSSVNIGDNAIITIDRKSAAFTNTVTYNIGGITGTIAEKTTETVLSLPTSDIADEIYALIPTAKQIQGTIYCSTYSGDTKIGDTTSANFYVYAKEADCKPTVTGTIVDTYPRTIALTGNANTIVKYASMPNVTINATANKGATISKYIINANDGQSIEEQEFTFLFGIASDKVTISAIDSRGFNTTVDLTPTVVDYVPIIISGLTAERTEDVSNEIVINASGVWYNGNFASNKSNELSCLVYYRESGAEEWTQVTSPITVTTEGNTFKIEDVSLGNIFDYEKQWQLRVRVQDLVDAVDRDDISVSKGQEVIAIGDHKVWVYGDLFLNDKKVNIIEITTGEEIATNEYINGKRVYKKMLECGAMTGTELNISHGITGYDLIWIDQSNTWLVAPDGAIGPLPFHNAHNANYSIEFFLSNSGNTIHFYSPNQKMANAYVTLKYTKQS